ncbi:MAG: CDP-alcohol phosphatidyltransferase family protein [Clostridia bacterium]|nr:CDP-alcohol phosphatidyltransferase family protein [Clostridia bacterium]
MKDLFKGCLTVPNLITLIRIVLIPFFAYFYLKGETNDIIIALIILALSGLSDFADGKIARKFNQVSNLGKILDPVADKLTQITIAIILFIGFRHAQNPIMQAFGWVFLVFLVKEGIMVIGGLLMLIFGIRPGAAEIYGKVATFVFYAAMILIIAFGPEIGLMSRLGLSIVMPDWLTVALVVICAIMTIVAFCSYMPETHRQVQERFGKKDKNEISEEK